jgi:hypothetical protein
MNDSTCRYTAGRVLVRRCELRADFRCARCGMPVCSRHGTSRVVEGGVVVTCPDCALRETPTVQESGDSSSPVMDELFDAPSSRSTYRSTSSRTVPTATVPTATEAADPAPIDEPFTEEEVASFDDLSDFDKETERDGSYDS